MSVLNGANLIDIRTGSVSALHSVGVSDLEMRVEDYPSASLFCHILVSILGIHVVFAEGTAQIIEFRAV